MKKTISGIVISILLILIASDVRAEPGKVTENTVSTDRVIRLVTPPLFVEGATIFSCTAVNLHPRAIQVDIRIFDQTGTNTCGVGPQNLGPGETAVQLCNGDIFTEFQGSGIVKSPTPAEVAWFWVQPSLIPPAWL